MTGGTNASGTAHNRTCRLLRPCSHLRHSSRRRTDPPMPQSHPQGPSDPPAFLAWENRRHGGYEPLGVEMRAIAGGARVHDLVRRNILVALCCAIRL